MSAQLINKDWIVHSLVQYQMEHIRNGRYGLWLLHALEKGFEGFSNMSDEQLQAELAKRGLRAEFEVPEAPVDEEDDADFEDDDDLQVSLRAVAAADRWTD
jgi:hypothetical protein